MKAYKIFFYDKLLDVIIEPFENGKSFLTPSSQNVSEKEYLRTYSEYTYNIINHSFNDYMIDKLMKKKVLSKSSSIEDIRLKLFQCNAGGNAGESGIGYSITPININEVKIKLNIDSCFNLRVGETENRNNFFKIECIDID